MTAFVIRQVCGHFGFVVFRNLKIFNANDLVLFSDIDSINCMVVLFNQSLA